MPLTTNHWSGNEQGVKIKGTSETCATVRLLVLVTESELSAGKNLENEDIHLRSLLEGKIQRKNLNYVNM